MIELILYDCRFQICLAWLFSLLQFTTNFRKHRQKWSVTKQMEDVGSEYGRIHLDYHTNSGWEFIQICRVFSDSIAFEKLMYCSFLQTVEVGVKIWSSFADIMNWYPNLSGWMNFPVIQDVKDHNQGIQEYKTKSCSVFKWVEAHGFLSKSRSI